LGSNDKEPTFVARIRETMYHLSLININLR